MYCQLLTNKWFSNEESIAHFSTLL